MAESTQVRQPSLPDAKPLQEAAAHGGKAGGFRQALTHIFFWAYERGTWQYDLIVIAILAFIFLTPRSWFQDRATLQLTDLRNHQGVVEVARSGAGGTYLVDARLVDATTPEKMEESVQEIVRSRAGRPFAIKSILPVRDRNNILLGYTVEIQFR
jgi:hypothetical protein